MDAGAGTNICSHAPRTEVSTFAQAVLGFVRLLAAVPDHIVRAVMFDTVPSEHEGAPHDRGLSGAGAQRMSELVELSRDECLKLLASHSFGRLAVSMGARAPVIRPVNYVFDRASQSVVFRTARGSKFHALLDSVDAAFEIDGIDERSRTGWSVIIHGVNEAVTNQSDIARLDRLGLQPWAPGDKRHWMHIRAWTVSGRRIVLPHSSTPGTYLV